MRIYLAIMLFSFATPAHSGIADWCVEEYKAGNKKGGDHWAEAILKGGRTFDKREAKTAEECIKIHTGEEHTYIPSSKEFISTSNMQKNIEAEEAIQKSIKTLEQRQAERELAVMKKLSDSCERLYERDEITAITNQLCYQYFFSTGLPAN